MSGAGFRNEGLTLVEVLILLVIIAGIVAAVLPTILSRIDDERAAAARSELEKISRALESYRLDNRIYPSSEQGLSALVTEPTGKPRPGNWQNGGYLSGNQVPLDPWGNPYRYRHGPDVGEYRLYSMGADGAPGGEGGAADIIVRRR